jgi:hypothetical protein
MDCVSTGAGQVSNAAFSFTTMDNLASGEKMVLKTSLQKSGIDDQQFEHLGPRLLLLQVSVFRFEGDFCLVSCTQKRLITAGH